MTGTLLRSAPQESQSNYFTTMVQEKEKVGDAYMRPVQDKAKKRPVQDKAKSAARVAPVYTIAGEKTGTEELPAEIFAQVVNTKLIAHYVRVYLNNQRQGNASAKTRTEVVGTTQKVYRQKGTGRARHGSAKANLFRGGGVTFGPLLRDFSMSINKKQKKQALYASLSEKAAGNVISIIHTTDFGDTPKTKKITELLKVMKSKGKVLFVFSRVSDTPMVKSLRNLKKIDIVQASTLNAYEVLNHREILFVDDAVSVLTTHFLKS